MTTFLGVSEVDESSPFPDGQPHVTLPEPLYADSILSCRIVTPDDLVRVGLAAETMKRNGEKVNLRIYYLMGGRMDRRLSDNEPYTLRVVCNIINSFGCDSVAVFVPHSQATSDLLRNYRELPPGMEDCFYDTGILRCIEHMACDSQDRSQNRDTLSQFIRNMSDIAIVFPDAGAAKRYSKSLLLKWYPNAELVTLYKDRNERTGKINGTKILNGTPRKHSVIIDDLCDGGATFRSAAETLRNYGAKTVGLVVAHGVFSKGTTIPGIDFIATSNSFCERESTETLYVHNYL